MSTNRIILAILFLLTVPFWPGAGEQLPVTEIGEAEQLIRLHVVAHSDTVEDQNLKLKVRDEILSVLAPVLQKAGDKNQAARVLSTQIETIRKTAERVIAGAGYNYPVKVELGRRNFPTRLYGNQLYPSGNYDALTVTIGAGSGRNWWCVLFPPLCFSVVSDERVETAAAGIDFSPPPRPKSYFLEVWDKVNAWVKNLFST